MDIFKPEDFEKMSAWSKWTISNESNKIFNAWLEKHKIIFIKDNYGEDDNFSPSNDGTYTYTCRIVDIQPIKKPKECLHQIGHQIFVNGGPGWLCVLCNKRLEPTGWTEVTE